MFNGNAREAMEFYHKCLGGKLELMTYEDYPDDNLSPEHRKRIMHGILHCEHISIMASDKFPDRNSVPGDNVHLSIDCVSESELTRLFFSLGEGGQITFELQDTFWGARFGQIRDKFGINWMMNYDRV